MKTPWNELRLRPVSLEDVEPVLALAASGGKTLTTLPEDRDFIEKRIRRSLHAFHPEVHEPGAEAYTFVLEHVPSGELAGISAIYARTGGFDPFYTYERIQSENVFAPLGICQPIETLECRHWHKGPSELGSLFLQKAFRGSGVGKILSLGRILFMGAFPERFEEEVIAEIRGWQDSEGRFPFWDAVIHPFFGTAFEKMDAISGVGEKDFLGALLPKHPIYCNLLPAAIREVLGRPHRDAEPAMAMLLREGFERTQYIDVFDAGPMIRARLSDLQCLQRTRSVTLASTTDSAPQDAAGPLGILYRKDLDFTAVLTAALPEEDGSVSVSPVQQAMLGVKEGTSSTFGYMPLTTSGHAPQRPDAEDGHEDPRRPVRVLRHLI